MATTRDHDARLATIRSLLAKAENTPYPDEAATYMGKVAELIGRWGIDEALVWADADEADRDDITSTIVAVHAPYGARKAVLINEIALACGCRAVRTLTRGDTHRVTVVGFAGDVARVELLATSLLVQLTRDMLAATPTGDSRRTAAWRRSFIVSFADRIGARLRDARVSATFDADRDACAADATRDATSTALVLVNRDAAVDAAYRAQFPQLRTARVSSGGSSSGARAGREAADRANIATGHLDGAPVGALGAAR
jgi:hypothetical protein